jgi:dTDP-4-amino-4,6-dideoxy-D-galactose acyltransferase
MEIVEPCEFLPWDTNFFGRRIARVREHRLDPHRTKEILEWCRVQSIECLYFLADSDHAETVRLAENHGFRFVDIRVTLQQSIRGQQSAPKDHRADAAAMIRLARASDIPFLQAIARNCHSDSRFYYDPGFPTASCEALYETWIKRSCEDYADAVLVAELDDQPVGYVSCHLRADPPHGQIGLVGLAEQARGHGLGQILVNRSLDWFAQHNISQVSVVTQGRNVAAQRLYQRCGFLIQSVQLWFHRWAKDSVSEGAA